jgi:hypothetical protein
MKIHKPIQGWTNYLTRNLSLPSHIFVAGGFAEDPTSSAPITSRSIIADGVESLNTVKLYAQHTYQYSTCDPARNAIATLANLVSHRNITVRIDLPADYIRVQRSTKRLLGIP